MANNHSILTLNCGSSSVKFALIALSDQQTLFHGVAEKIGQTDCQLNYTYQNNKSEEALPSKTYQEIFSIIEQKLNQFNLLNSIVGIGHRVVHGGNLFKNAVLIDSKAIDTIDSLIPLAPLHNPHNLAGIKFCQNIFQSIAQIAVFDTSFHQTIPQTNYTYAIDYKLYEEHHIRKYGFHGISHQYLSQKADEILHIQNGNYISLHLGNGCSITAIQNGQSYDTSMGLTPLDGLVMGTRSGTIDPGIINFLSNTLNMDIKEIDHLLNYKSGLLGLCGFSDMRKIETLANEGNHHAILALDIFTRRIAFYASAYFAYYEKLDALIFSGGIGENSTLIRQLVIDKLKNLNFLLDKNNNHQHGKESNYHINTIDSLCVLVIPTNEELMIAKEVENLLS